jgi:hypothetical protein
LLPILSKDERYVEEKDFLVLIYDARRDSRLDFYY